MSGDLPDLARQVRRLRRPISPSRKLRLLYDETVRLKGDEAIDRNSRHGRNR